MVSAYTIQTVTASATLSSLNDAVFITASSSDITITLPMILTNGQKYLLKRFDSESVTVSIIPNGSNTISGSSSQNIGNSQIIEIVSFNGDWTYVANASF